MSVEVGASLSRQIVAEGMELVAPSAFCANTLNIFLPFCNVVGTLHVDVESITPMAF